MRAMPLGFEFRSAASSDLDFCWLMYRDAMKPLTEAVGRWEEPIQHKLIQKAVHNAHTSILRQDDADAGWLQIEEGPQVVHLQQLFLLPDRRNRGLGTAFLSWMKDRAERKRKDLTLEVMTNSQACRLYERLGFKPVTTADHKTTMRY
jgi:GNAT superfamily N-acetyltransferase